MTTTFGIHVDGETLALCVLGNENKQLELLNQILNQSLTGAAFGR